MTTGPRLYRGSKRRGIVAVALLALFALVFLRAAGDALADGAGLEGGSITAGLGYLLFDMPGRTDLGAEGFLAAFEIIDVVLVAALVAAVMLARREREGGDV